MTVIVRTASSFARMMLTYKGEYLVGEDGVAYLPLVSHDWEVQGYTAVDQADAELLGQHRWNLHGNYVARMRDGKSSLLHREIMGEPPKPGMIVDHINHDKLDNRRENLRWLTKQQNLKSIW